MKKNRILGAVALLLAAAVITVIIVQSGGPNKDLQARIDASISALPTAAPSGSYDPEPSARAIDSKRAGLVRAKVALQEYKRGVIESPTGCNCGPRINLYTQSHPMQWCASFVSWVAMRSGTPVTGSDDDWRITNSRKMYRIFKKHDQFFSREEIESGKVTPRIGDLLIFYRGNYAEELGHVSVLVNVTGKGRGDVVDGNWDNRLGMRSDLDYLNYYGFIGIGRPQPD